MHKLGIANLAINPFNIGFDNSGFMFYETCSSIHKLSELYQDPVDQELQNLYISQELYNKSYESINPEKCDVFSLGIIFYNLISFNFPLSLQDLEKNLDEMTLNDALSIFKRLIPEMISLDPLARPPPNKIIQDISEIRNKLISG
jgi:serine/threonine protein kinase